jgi:hypothetical protein
MMVIDGRKLALHPAHAVFDALPFRMRLLDPVSLRFEKNDVLVIVLILVAAWHMFPANADAAAAAAAAAVAYQGKDGLSLVVY